MNKKYELTKETITFKGKILYRIRALKDFSDVRKGDLGGWVEGEHNLSQEGDCWIYDNGCVSDHGGVYDNGCVSGHGHVSDHGCVSGHGCVSDNGHVSGHGLVTDHGRVSGHGLVIDHGRVSGNGHVAGQGRVSGHGHVTGNGAVTGLGRVSGHGWVSDNGHVSGHGLVTDHGRVLGNGHILHYRILKDSQVCTHTIFYDSDYFILKDEEKHSYKDCFLDPLNPSEEELIMFELEYGEPFPLEVVKSILKV